MSDDFRDTYCCCYINDIGQYQYFTWSEWKVYDKSKVHNSSGPAIIYNTEVENGTFGNVAIQEYWRHGVNITEQVHKWLNDVMRSDPLDEMSLEETEIFKKQWRMLEK